MADRLLLQCLGGDKCSCKFIKVINVQRIAKAHVLFWLCALPNCTFQTDKDVAESSEDEHIWSF